MGTGEGEDAGSGGPGGGTPNPERGASPPLRMPATDLAILTAFCRPYTAGRRFPSPAPNNKILQELAADGVFLDLDSLRGHLRNLYARFGVEEGLTPAEKRVRLVELVYENDVIPGWGSAASQQRPAAARAAPAPPSDASSAPGGPPPDAVTHADTGTSTRRLLALAGDHRWALAGLAVVLIGVAVLAIIDAGSAQKAPAIEVIDLDSMPGAVGHVTYCTGTDVASRGRRIYQHAQAIKDFNAQFKGRIHAELVELHAEATLQHQEFGALQRRRSDYCDVFYSDVIWTAEFAHNGWLLDLSPYVGPRQDSYLPTMLEAARFDGRYWGVPKQADAGLIFRNAAAEPRAPSTWQELYRRARRPPGDRFRYQAFDYEGLTVNFLELAYAAGATDIVTPGHRANVDQPQTRRALTFMVDGLRDGAAPTSVRDQDEENTVSAFVDPRKRVDFMRNWPYVYAKLRDPATYPGGAADVRASPLPRWQGRNTPASVLGGHILVISAFTKNPGAALALVDYLASRKVIERDAVDFALAPALAGLWKDQRVRAALPAVDDLEQEIVNARLRPVTPVYDQISQIISSTVNAALQGKISPGDALRNANSRVQQALDNADG
jgi:multiple sugar transport system substrate-binding protein